MKNSVEGLNRRLDKTEERISELKYRAVEFIQSAGQKEKKNEKVKIAERNAGMPSR